MASPSPSNRDIKSVFYNNEETPQKEKAPSPDKPAQEVMNPFSTIGSKVRNNQTLLQILSKVDLN